MNITTIRRTRTQTMRTLQQESLARTQTTLRDRAGAALDVVSPLGWTVVAIAISSWVGAAVLGWEELAAVTMGSIVLIVVCGLFAIGRLDLESEISVPAARVVVGASDVRGRLEITNRRAGAVRGARIELPIGDQVVMFPVARLAGSSSVSHEFDVPTDRRAVLDVGPVTTVQGDPLGLFRRVRSWSEVYEIFVHPRTVPLPSLVSGLIRDVEAQATPELSPSDVSFHALRDYVPGDDRRHVHWKSSAKLGRLMVKQYVDTRRSHIGVAVSADLAEYADESEFELAISSAASVALQALSDGENISVFAGGVQIPTTNPRSTLDHFSAIEPQGPAGALSETMIALQSHAPGASVAVVCAGSTIDLTSLRLATAWIHGTIETFILQSDVGNEPSFQPVGSTILVRVPDLDRLSAGLRVAVASSA